MNRIVVIAAILCSCRISSAVADDRPLTDDAAALSSVPASLAQDDVAALIQQLGSDDYVVRARAELRLIEAGASVYDQLKEAEHHVDLEIADRARYILHRIEIAWIAPDDADEVKRVLAHYPELSEVERLQVIRRLRRFEAKDSIGPLCRIVRFDASEPLAKHAALAVLQLQLADGDATHLAAACQHELDACKRTAARWVQDYVRGVATPPEDAHAWRALFDEELKELISGSGRTDPHCVLMLLQHALERSHAAGLVEKTWELVEQAIALSELDPRHLASLKQYAANEPEEFATRSEPTAEEVRAELLRWSLRWIVRNQAWDILQKFDEKFGEEYRPRRSYEYTLAAAERLQGRDELAEQRARTAFEQPDIDQDSAELRLTAASAAADWGEIEWAKREYRYVIDREAEPDESTANAISNLGALLHDEGRDDQASAVMGQFCDQLNADSAAKRQLIISIDRRYRSAGIGRPYLAQIYARRAYYQALHHRAQGNHEEKRAQLLAATIHYPLDADVLIAMFHARGEDVAFKRRTLALMGKAKRDSERQLDQGVLSWRYYNQWAWLVANTTGDFQRAIEYSHRSLDIRPHDEPSFLDTLGRCYYAAGEYEQAIRYQRRAIALEPHMQVMRRQLELFEAALAQDAPPDESSEPGVE